MRVHFFRRILKHWSDSSDGDPCVHLRCYSDPGVVVLSQASAQSEARDRARALHCRPEFATWWVTLLFYVFFFANVNRKHRHNVYVQDQQLRPWYMYQGRSWCPWDKAKMCHVLGKKLSTHCYNYFKQNNSTSTTQCTRTKARPVATTQPLCSITERTYSTTWGREVNWTTLPWRSWEWRRLVLLIVSILFSSDSKQT